MQDLPCAVSKEEKIYRMTFPYNHALVTGGAGFIGSHLTEALLEAGCRVTVLDNLSSGRPENLAAVRDRLTFVEGDICEFDTVLQAAGHCDVLFHLAAVVSVPQTVDDPLGSAMVNDLGTLHVLEAARRQQAAGVVFASSSAVYGDDPELPKTEAMAPRTLSPYAVHKISGEYYAAVFQQLYDLNTASLRFFNVYGPRQDPSSAYSGVISIFMARAVRNQAPTIHGDGTQSRDFIYVKDVVRACLLAAASPRAAGQAINIGSGVSVTIGQLWQTIRRLSGCQREPQFAPPRPGDIHASLADITRAESLLDFEPSVPFDQGLALTFDWYRSEYDREN
jgi:UDP-glucose 4-epimerase